MKKKAMLMLLAGVFALVLLGCRDDEVARDANAPTTGDVAEQTPGVQPVPEGQPGTADTGAPGGTAADTLAEQRNSYVQGAEQILNNIEQKFAAWQQQAGTQGQQGQEQLQELGKQVQEQLAEARAAVDQMRTATGTQLKEAKVAADQAIRDAEAAFMNLQSRAAQTQVTQAQ